MVSLKWFACHASVQVVPHFEHIPVDRNNDSQGVVKAKKPHKKLLWREYLLGEGRDFTRLVLFSVDWLRVGVGERHADCLAVFHEDSFGGRYSRILEVGIGHLGLGHMKLSSLLIVCKDFGCGFFWGSPLRNHD